MRDDAGLAEEIRALAKARDAVILAHNYQRPEVQDVADFVGDSLGLSRSAANTDREVIVFAGVHFMAETAAILAPGRTVVMPEDRAGCPMADMITARRLAAWRSEWPGVPVVTYVNSSAEVKAGSDICCTSANAVEVVRSLGVDRVLFAPDRNLASWVALNVPEVDVIAWNGFCPTHERVTAEAVMRASEEHPHAEVMVHPECRPEVVALGDRVFSTSQMLRHAAGSDCEEFVVVTEQGLLHALKKAAPAKRFHELSSSMICPNMKLTTLEKVRDCLVALEPRIAVADDVRERALSAVERMVAIG